MTLERRISFIWVQYGRGSLSLAGSSMAGCPRGYTVASPSQAPPGGTSEGAELMATGIPHLFLLRYPTEKERSLERSVQLQSSTCTCHTPRQYPRKGSLVLPGTPEHEWQAYY